MIFSTKKETLELMRGNQAAADFIELAVEVLHFWDDLIDRDHDLLPEVINDRMFKALVTLPRNPFYVEHFATLSVVLVNAITNWHIANKMESGSNEYELRIAYILRSSYVDLVTTAAGLVGGMEWAVEAGELVRLHAHKEQYEGYKLNLQLEKAERSARENQ